MTPPRSIWWLVGGTLLLAVFAPTSLPLAGVTFAGLQLSGGARSRWVRGTVLLIGLVALGALVLPRKSAVDAVVGTFHLFAATAFVVMTWNAPGPFFGRASGAIGWAALTALVFAWIVNGANTWGLLAWDTVRQTSLELRTAFEVMAAAGWTTFGKMEAAVRFFSAARPALAVLWGYAALALAWAWHVRSLDAGSRAG